MYIRKFHSDHTALLYTLTVGLLVPALVLAWLTSVLTAVTVVDEPRTVTPTASPDVRAPLPSEVHSAWVSQSGPASILVDGTAEYEMVFRNAGSVAWVRGTASEVRLGIAGDDPAFAERGFAIGWPLPTRVAVQSEPVVDPGELVTFRFNVHGASAGTLVLPLRPVIDGVAWLEDEGAHIELIVGAVSATGSASAS